MFEPNSLSQGIGILVIGIIIVAILDVYISKKKEIGE